MGFWIAVLIIFIFIIIIGVISSIVNSRNRKAIQLDRNARGVIYGGKLAHIGGHPYLQQNGVYESEVGYDFICFVGLDRVIPIPAIVRCEIRTAESITHDATLSRFVALGALAFAFKKETTHLKNYYLLSYYDNNVLVDCLFTSLEESDGINTLNFVSAINRARIEFAERHQEVR